MPATAESDIGAAGGAITRAFPRFGAVFAASSAETFAATLRADGAGVDAVAAVPHADDFPEPLVDGLEAFAPPDPLSPYQWNIRRVRADRVWPLVTDRGTTIAVAGPGVADNIPGLEVVESLCFNDAVPCSDTDPSGSHDRSVAASSFGAGPFSVDCEAARSRGRTAVET